MPGLLDNPNPNAWPVPQRFPDPNVGGWEREMQYMQQRYPWLVPRPGTSLLDQNSQRFPGTDPRGGRGLLGQDIAEILQFPQGGRGLLGARQGTRGEGGGGGQVVQIPQQAQPQGNPYFGKYSNQPPASYESTVLQQQHMAKVQDAVKNLPDHIVAKIDKFSEIHGSSPYVRGNALIDAANMKAARQAWESYSGKNPDIMPPGMQYPQGKPPTDPGRGMLKDIIEGKMPGVTFTRGPENDPRMGPKSSGGPVWSYQDAAGAQKFGRFENASKDGKTYHLRGLDGKLDVLTGDRLKNASANYPPMRGGAPPPFTEWAAKHAGQGWMQKLTPSQISALQDAYKAIFGGK